MASTTGHDDSSYILAQYGTHNIVYTSLVGFQNTYDEGFEARHCPPMAMTSLQIFLVHNDH